MLPEFLEGEQVGGVLGAVEDVGGGAVDRHGAGVGGGVGRVAAVEAEGFEFHRLIFGYGDNIGSISRPL